MMAPPKSKGKHGLCSDKENACRKLHCKVEDENSDKEDDEEESHLQIMHKKKKAKTIPTTVAVLVAKRSIPSSPDDTDTPDDTTTQEGNKSMKSAGAVIFGVQKNFEYAADKPVTVLDPATVCLLKKIVNDNLFPACKFWTCSHSIDRVMGFVFKHLNKNGLSDEDRLWRSLHWDAVHKFINKRTADMRQLVIDRWHPVKDGK
jgi:hypothetical protein